MSKTWKQPREDNASPQRVIDRLSKLEALKDIREALQPREAASAR